MALMNLQGQTDYKLIDGLIVFPKTLAVHREDGRALGFLPKGTEEFPDSAAKIMELLVDADGKKMKKEVKPDAKTQLEQLQDTVTAHPHEIKLQITKINEQREAAGLPTLEEEAEEAHAKEHHGKSKKSEDDDDDHAKAHKKK